MDQCHILTPKNGFHHVSKIQENLCLVLGAIQWSLVKRPERRGIHSTIRNTEDSVDQRSKTIMGGGK